MDSSNLQNALLASAASGFILATLLYVAILLPVQKRRYTSELRERKDQFISLASHYLLNPIAIIQSAVAALQEKDTVFTTEQRNQHYDAIVRGQQRLWIVTQQLILVGEIDQSNLVLHPAVGNLYDTVAGAIAAVDPFARAKNLKVSLIDDMHEVREARFDERRLKQAIIALIDNAVKFSQEAGEIQVKISQQSGLFTISIEDNGIGMADEIMSHITEEFYRGTQMYTYDYEGLGLGLHIAKAIARLHQGNVKFSSKPKRGTQVLFQFPSLQ